VSAKVNVLALRAQIPFISSLGIFTDFQLLLLSPQFEVIPLAASEAPYISKHAVYVLLCVMQ